MVTGSKFKVQGISLQACALYLVSCAFINSCAQREPDNFVLVKGNNTISGFYVSKYEITQQEWQHVMGNNPSTFKGDRLPVETVTWYDGIEYCNQRSIKEGLQPYYTINKDQVGITNSNGYRLPTEAEWEYAASGGQLSKNYTYAGSDTVNIVAWYWENSGDKPLTGVWSWAAIKNNHNETKPVGSKNANELGLYDMSGNVREWCEDWYEDRDMPVGTMRVWRGGGWMGADISCASTFRGNFQANGAGSDQGFRVCRNR